MGKRYKTIRIDDLEFGQCTYLCEPPEIPSWEIKQWCPNYYYGKKNEYIEVEPGKYQKQGEPNVFISEGCFEHKECCHSIGIWRWNERDEYFEFEFVGSRPLDLNHEQRETFWEILEWGEWQLNDRPRYGNDK